MIKNSQGQATNVILVVQYRPALSAFTVEFPSGLIDGGEEPATAAIRELQEETGFSQESGHKVKVISTSVPVAYEPGLTSSCSKVVVAEVSDIFFPSLSCHAHTGRIADTSFPLGSRLRWNKTSSLDQTHFLASHASKMTNGVFRLSSCPFLASCTRLKVLVLLCFLSPAIAFPVMLLTTKYYCRAANVCRRRLQVGAGQSTLCLGHWP